MKGIVKNSLMTIIALCVAFGLCLFLQEVLNTNQALIPAIFILAVFYTSVIADGYIYGIVAAILSVLAVNFAFTFPYFKLNFTIPENLVSAIVMIMISLITCALTAKIKKQEEIKMEGERERMRANLLRAVSHDLRTPLTTIYGSSSVLIDNYADFSEEQHKKMLLGIKEDAQWLSRMVENLLSITRLDNGNVKLIKSPTVLDELCDSILLKFSKRYADQNVIVDIPSDFITIPMDAILIEQVAINILENAVQHSIGMTELHFRVFVIGNRAIFEIKDNGCGIKEERLNNLFTGYYDCREEISDGKKNNAGIGLSVCASIIKAHGGDITAENSKDGGAVFRFILSMEEQE